MVDENPVQSDVERWKPIPDVLDAAWRAFRIALHNRPSNHRLLDVENGGAWKHLRYLEKSTGMLMKQRLGVALFGALAWIALDQLTKSLFQNMLAPGDVVSLLAGSLLVLPTYNHGAFLSVGAALSEEACNAVFIYGVLIILAGLLVWVIRVKRISCVELVAVASILGGGASNLLDRFAYDGWVFDFLNVGIGALRTGIFNVADVGITVGAGLLLFCSIRSRSAQPKLPI